MCKNKIELIGSLDQGTQSTRFTLYNKNFDIYANAYEEHTQIRPVSGWCEHNPIEILEKVYSVMNKVFDDINKKTNEYIIKAIGIANQRETIVVWDKFTGEPLYNAIVWHDTRSADIVETLITNYGSKDVFVEITGLPLNTYFSATKIFWLIKNFEFIKNKLNQKTALIGTIDTWLIWNLTGGIDGGIFATDITNAARTMLFDISLCNWSTYMLNIFEVPHTSLAKIYSNSELFGFIKNKHLSNFTNIPITGCLGDQHAAALGQIIFNLGEIKATFGTGAFFLMNTGDKYIISKYGLLTTPCFKIGPNNKIIWALEGSISIAGSAISWLKDNLNFFDNAEDSETLANKVNDSEGVVFVPAFSGLFAPRWRTDVRGGLFGLSLKHTKSHIIYALLQSIAYMSYEIIEAMKNDIQINYNPTVKVDGGMSKNNLFIQICSDIMQTQISKQRHTEVTSLGAAIAAALHVNFTSSLDEAKEKIHSTSKIWNPQKEKAIIDEEIKLWNSTVERCLNWHL